MLTNKLIYGVLLGLLVACGTERPPLAGHEVEGDILVPEGGPQERVLIRTGNAVEPALTWARWPKGRIAYRIDPTLPNPQRVLEAIDHFQQKTNLRFIPRTTQTAYVNFKPWSQGYCRSWILKIAKR